MRLSLLCTLGVFAASISLGVAPVRAADAPPAQKPTPDQVKFFETQVRPLLAASCINCHGDQKQKGRLRLDSLAAALKGDAVPVILFGKGNAPYLDDLFASGADAIGVDWTVTLEDAARRNAGRVALQGNLDPAMLYGNPDAVRAQARAVLDSYAAGNGGSREGHVFNLGHGLSPDMDPAHVAALVDEVHAYSRR